MRYSRADEYCFNRVPKVVNFRSRVRNVGVSPTSLEANSQPGRRAPINLFKSMNAIGRSTDTRVRPAQSRPLIVIG